jgi:hypothetical protein
MPRDHQRNAEPNATDRIVGESGRFRHTLADLEAAWAKWSRHIDNIEDRDLSLLKTAFEAGFEAGNSPQKSRD